MKPDEQDHTAQQPGQVQRSNRIGETDDMQSGLAQTAETRHGRHDGDASAEKSERRYTSET